MNWDLSGDRPIWLQLTEQLRLGIVTGEYRAGDRLPSVRELAAEAAVNPNTMQRALSELETTGLLSTQRTSGRFVTRDEELIREAGRQMAREETARFLARMENLGLPREEILEFVRREAEGKEKNDGNKTD